MDTIETLLRAETGAAAFCDPDAGASTTTSGPGAESKVPLKPPTKRLEVMCTLCHRTAIRGRATTAWHVREVVGFEVSEKPKELQQGRKTRSQTKLDRQQAQVELEVIGTRDYVLKLVWRDPNKTIEGEVLKRLAEIYGVGQYMWHSDTFKACDSLDCGRSIENSCGKCLDRTPDSDGAWIKQDLTNQSNISKISKISKKDKGAETSTVGSPLCTAGSPRELLEATLDALLGYWRTVNMGLLHRDISNGNVLMLQEGGYSKKVWEPPRTATSVKDLVLSRPENLRQGFLHGIHRDSTGMLNDCDLFRTHSMLGIDFFADSSLEDDELRRDEDRSKRRKLDLEANESGSSEGKGREVSIRKQSSFSRVVKADKNAPRFDFCTGTPAFMSARVLNMKVGEQYEHHFMDDLESFFWLILWCIAGHVDPGVDRPTKTASELADNLRHHRLSSIYIEKLSILTDCVDEGIDMRKTLAACENTWASNPIVISLILKLGSYFYDAFLSRSPLSNYSPDEVFPIVVGILMDSLKLLS